MFENIATLTNAYINLVLFGNPSFIQVLSHYNASYSDELLIKDVITPGSELLQTIAVDLNREEVPGVKNWRHLACKLEVPRDKLQEFSGESTAKRRPTKEVIQWLCVRFPDTTLNDLVHTLEKIQRNDAIEIIKQFAGAFGECKVNLV